MIARVTPRVLAALLTSALLAATATDAIAVETLSAHATSSSKSATHATSGDVTDPDLVTREQMVVISRQLGVTCTHCHETNDYKSKKLKTWGVAKEHIRVVNWLNSKDGFGGKSQVDCYMCHRGEAKPPLREPQPRTATPDHKAEH